MPDIKKDRGSKQPRTSRSDGDMTRARIIDIAGRLFAQNGYSETTSKQISEHAGINMAAINYHFGSRENLYLAVLEEADRYLVGLDYLNELESSGDPNENLARVIGSILEGVDSPRGWQTSLWIREVLAPSAILPLMMQTTVLPKFRILERIVSEITGIPVDEPILMQGMVSTLAPCVLLLSVDKPVTTPISRVAELPADQLADYVTTFALAGLHAVAERYAQDRARGAEATTPP